MNWKQLIIVATAAAHLALITIPTAALAESFCPEGGERYSSSEKFCPTHGVKLKQLSTASDSKAMTPEDLDSLNAEGEKLQTAQNYTEASKWFRKAAEKGHTRAQYNLGQMYYLGNGLAQNYEAAFKWYRKAAEQGYGKAEHAMGWMHFAGEGVAIDYKEAFKWYRKAAEKGIMRSQHGLALQYLHGQGVKQNPQEAARWFRKAAAQGDSYAQQRLDEIAAGRIPKPYAEQQKQAAQERQTAAITGCKDAVGTLSDGINPDKQKKLIQVCTTAIDLAPEAELYLFRGMLYWMTEPTLTAGGKNFIWKKEYNQSLNDADQIIAMQTADQEIKGAAHLMRALIFRLNAEYLFLAGKKQQGLARIEQALKEVETSLSYTDKTQKMKPYYESIVAGFKAAQAKSTDPVAQTEQGRTLMKERSYSKAIQPLYTAALQGHAPAQERLGVMFSHKITEENAFSYPEALVWLKLAEKQSNADAIARIGQMYSKGTFLEKDETEAFRKFSKAAKLGSNIGLFQLALHYKEGKGVKQDYKKAFELLQKVVKKEPHPAIQINIGDLYRDGHGVRKNVATAKSWYQKAAEQWNKQGQERLDALAEGGAPAAAKTQYEAAAGQTNPGTPHAVVEVLNSGGYTYMRLQAGSAERWIAVPQTKVKVGDRITYEAGMPMGNYTSKSLNRTFKMIQFCDEVKLVR